ncbi:hypothetical protein PIB30_115388, partial [Stylosanthes scabra]|nr:hypothetical protein [Stylosanthes scabra]
KKCHKRQYPTVKAWPNKGTKQHNPPKKRKQKLFTKLNTLQKQTGHSPSSSLRKHLLDILRSLYANLRIRPLLCLRTRLLLGLSLRIVNPPGL